jgi:hypothetical protein
MDPEASDTSAEGTATCPSRSRTDLSGSGTGLSGSRTDVSGSHSSQSGPGMIIKRVAVPATLPEWIPQLVSQVSLTPYCDPAAGADGRLLAVAFVFLPQKSGSCLTHSGSG